MFLPTYVFRPKAPVTEESQANDLSDFFKKNDKEVKQFGMCGNLHVILNHVLHVPQISAPPPPTPTICAMCCDLPRVLYLVPMLVG